MDGGITVSTDKVFSDSLNGTFYDKNHPFTKAYTPVAITPKDLKG